MGFSLFGSENLLSLTLKAIDLQGEIFIDISHYQPIGVYSDGHKWLPVVLCFMKRSAVRAYVFESLQDAMTPVKFKDLREERERVHHYTGNQDRLDFTVRNQNKMKTHKKKEYFTDIYTVLI